MSEEVKQQIHDVMASHGIHNWQAWYVLIGMADDLAADLHGVVA